MMEKKIQKITILDRFEDPGAHKPDSARETESAVNKSFEMKCYAKQYVTIIWGSSDFESHLVNQLDTNGITSAKCLINCSIS